MSSLRLPLACLVALALYAGRAGAPPPVSAFPADLRPAPGGAAPPNARLWAFGRGAPPLAQIGVALTADGAPVEGALEALGCCGVVLTPSSSFAPGVEVLATVSSAGGELSTSFSAQGADDTTPPTLREPALLDESGGALVIGVEGADDRGLAGFLAKAVGSTVGAAPPGFILESPPGDDGCVDVVAVDLAGNESEARRVCGASGDDGGPGADGGPGGEPASGCAQGPGGSSGPALLALLGLLALGARRPRGHS